MQDTVKLLPLPVLWIATDLCLIEGPVWSVWNFQDFQDFLAISLGINTAVSRANLSFHKEDTGITSNVLCQLPRDWNRETFKTAVARLQQW